MSTNAKHEHEPELEQEHHHHHHENIDYGDAIRAFRDDKDEYFRTGAGSPLPAAERAEFGGLPYFDVDPALRFEGLTLEPYTGSEPARFSTRRPTGSYGRPSVPGPSGSRSGPSPPP